MILESDESKIFAKLSVSLEPGNLEKNKALWAPIEETFKKMFSKSDKFYTKFEITDTNLNITLICVVPKRKLPP